MSNVKYQHADYEEALAATGDGRRRRRGRAAAAVHARRREGRPQRSVPVRLGQEIQALPRQSRQTALSPAMAEWRQSSPRSCPFTTRRPPRNRCCRCRASRSARPPRRSRTGTATTCCSSSASRARSRRACSRRIASAPRRSRCAATHLARQHESGGGFRALVVNAGQRQRRHRRVGPRRCARRMRRPSRGCSAARRRRCCRIRPASSWSRCRSSASSTALPAARDRARAPTAGSPPRSAIMTTDTVPKGASRRVDVDGVPVTVTGIAKGAGMIHPDMATMLAFIATDAPIAAPLLARDRARGRRRLVQRRDRRRRHVDQRQLRARRHRQGADSRRSRSAERSAPRRRCAPRSRTCAIELAQAIVRDGEGATKFIAIRVEGGRDVDECRRVAFGIAHSPLVKTAFFASDPNLGRIVCAIGNAARRGHRSRARLVLARRRARRRPRRARRHAIARKTASA